MIFDEGEILYTKQIKFGKKKKSQGLANELNEPI